MTTEFYSQSEVNSRVVPDATFDLVNESKRVLRRLRKTAYSDERKMLSEVFDDKLSIAGFLIHQLVAKYGAQVSFQEISFFAAGYSHVEYEAILLTWREKLKHDRVRPITYIKGIFFIFLFSFFLFFLFFCFFFVFFFVRMGVESC